MVAVGELVGRRDGGRADLNFNDSPTDPAGSRSNATSLGNNTVRRCIGDELADEIFIRM